VRQTLGVSERRAFCTLSRHRSTQRQLPIGRPDEERLTADTIELTRQFGRNQQGCGFQDGQGMGSKE
jgi:hypothetical protein